MMRLVLLFALGLGGCGNSDAAGRGEPEDAGNAARDVREVDACMPVGADCTGDVRACCDGARCMPNAGAPEMSTCLQECAANADCPSACCAEYVYRQPKVCLDAQYCAACFGLGSRCSVVTDCCSGYICENGVCSPPCTGNGDCPSACCVADAPGGPTCMDPVYCQ